MAPNQTKSPPPEADTGSDAEMEAWSVAEEDRISKMPAEIAVCMVGNMRVPDMFAMRRVSRLWNHLIVTNQRAIARRHLDQGCVPDIALELFPPSDEVDLEYIAGLWYRLDVAFRFANLMVDNSRPLAGAVHLLRFSREKATTYERQLNGVIRERIPAVAFVLFHMLETFRNRLQPVTTDFVDVKAIMRDYSNATLLGLHNLSPLLTDLVMRSLIDIQNPIDQEGRFVPGLPGHVMPHLQLIWYGGLPMLLRTLRAAIADGDNGRGAMFRWHRELQAYLHAPAGSRLPTTRPGLFKKGPPMHELSPTGLAGLQSIPLGTLRSLWFGYSAEILRSRGLIGQTTRIPRLHDALKWMASDLATPLDELFRGSHFSEPLTRPLWLRTGTGR